MTASQSLQAEAAKRILVKDGAYGTSIQDRKLKSAEYCGGLDLLKDQRGNNDLLNLTRPDVVRSICESFADAGAEILATNSFNANSIRTTGQRPWSRRSMSRPPKSSGKSPTVIRRKTVSRAGSPARSVQPTRLCLSRRTSTILPSAKSTSTR